MSKPNTPCYCTTKTARDFVMKWFLSPPCELYQLFHFCYLFVPTTPVVSPTQPKLSSKFQFILAQSIPRVFWLSSVSQITFVVGFAGFPCLFSSCPRFCSPWTLTDQCSSLCFNTRNQIKHHEVPSASWCGVRTWGCSASCCHREASK